MDEMEGSVQGNVLYENARGIERQSLQNDRQTNLGVRF